jgi:predicted neuraminidase
MSRRLTTLLFGLALAAAVVLVLLRSGGTAAPEFARAEYRLPVPNPQPSLFQHGFISPEGLTAAVHSGTLVELPGGVLLAAWFGGSREGAADVAIYGARRDASGWSAPFVLTDRAASQRELGRALRKLGNPLLMRGAEGRIWLFYVTVSLGGWSTSSISYKVSDDNGHNWSPARRLVTSPFLNISTLIRNRPLLYADGGIALPAYHELLGKFSELLRLDPSGRVQTKYRMNAGRGAIQPSIVPTGPRRALAFFRRVGDSPPRVLMADSGDGGNSWSAPMPTDLPNPDAGVAALRTPNGKYLLAYNHSEQGRGSLSLALSSDGLRWRKRIDLERGGREDEFSYPFLIRTQAGEYHLIYTWQRRRMAHVHFNDAWLESLP